jgi:hypothetical protein
MQKACVCYPVCKYLIVYIDFRSKWKSCSVCVVLCEIAFHLQINQSPVTGKADNTDGEANWDVSLKA